MAVEYQSGTRAAGSLAIACPAGGEHKCRCRVFLAANPRTTPWGRAGFRKGHATTTELDWGRSTLSGAQQAAVILVSLPLWLVEQDRR